MEGRLALGRSIPKRGILKQAQLFEIRNETTATTLAYYIPVVRIVPDDKILDWLILYFFALHPNTIITPWQYCRIYDLDLPTSSVITLSLIHI